MCYSYIVMDEKRKIGIVTGGNAGMGYETALSLAIDGWEVILGCRSFARGNEAVMKMNTLLRQLEGGPGQKLGKAVFMELDLASFESIRNFVAGFKKRYSSCDLLVCNAGAMYLPHALTEDGFETLFQVNYLGHVYLFKQLLPFLQASGKARVLQVSSKAHEKVPFVAGDFLKAARRGKEEFKALKAYAQSKLFQVAFTRKAQEVYGKQGFSFYAVHPGLVGTDLFFSPVPKQARFLLGPIAAAGQLAGILRKPRRGAETTLYLCMSSTVPAEGGTYWADKSLRQPNPVLAEVSLVQEIWNETEKLLEFSDKAR